MCAPSQHQANAWEFEACLSSGSDLRVVPSASCLIWQEWVSPVLPSFPKGTQHLDSESHYRFHSCLTLVLALKGGKKIVLNSSSFFWGLFSWSSGEGTAGKICCSSCIWFPANSAISNTQFDQCEWTFLAWLPTHTVCTLPFGLWLLVGKAQQIAEVPRETILFPIDWEWRKTRLHINQIYTIYTLWWTESHCYAMDSAAILWESSLNSLSVCQEIWFISSLHV